MIRMIALIVALVAALTTVPYASDISWCSRGPSFSQCDGAPPPSPRLRAPARAARLAALARRAAGAAPHRIISLVPSVTEMLFAIGAGSQVVAVSSYDRFPPAAVALPKVGALVDPDFERILSLTPDLVIVYGTQNDLIARLTRARIPIFNYQHAGLADITETITLVGERVGHVAEARKEVARINGELDDVRRAVAGRPQPRTALIIGRELGTLRGMFASSGIGFMHDMLSIAGGLDVFGDVKRQSVQATTELLLARAPEVIIETYSKEGWTPARITSELAVWRGLPTLPAVRTNRVYILTDEALLVPGPRVTDGVRLLARTLHPGVKVEPRWPDGQMAR